MTRKITSKQLVRDIKLAIAAPKYEINDFWCTSPYDPTDLIQDNRKREVMNWRHVGLVWHVLSGLGPRQAGFRFERNHATALHSLKEVMKALELPHQYPEIMAVIDEVKAMSKKTYANVRDTEIASALHLEIAFSRMAPWEYNPAEFYCQQFVIAQRMGEVGKRCQKQCGGCR